MQNENCKSGEGIGKRKQGMGMRIAALALYNESSDLFI